MNSVHQLVNPLRDLQQYGQAIWLDFIRSSLITSGDLKRLVEEDGLKGLTSNPAIFEKAIAGSTDYASEIRAVSANPSLDANAVYEHLAIHDIQAAADVLHIVYEKTNRRDGYVSIEVSPLLASDTKATIAEGKRLWAAVNRENVMIKVPATPEGIPAIEELIRSGINVNVTLLFSQNVYEQVVDAYIAGVEALAAKGGDISKIASVASFFISRIDSMTDRMIEERLKTETDRCRLQKANQHSQEKWQLPMPS